MFFRAYGAKTGGFWGRNTVSRHRVSPPNPICRAAVGGETTQKHYYIHLETNPDYAPSVEYTFCKNLTSALSTRRVSSGGRYFEKNKKGRTLFILNVLPSANILIKIANNDKTIYLLFL